MIYYSRTQHVLHGMSTSDDCVCECFESEINVTVMMSVEPSPSLIVQQRGRKRSSTRCVCCRLDASPTHTHNQFPYQHLIDSISFSFFPIFRNRIECVYSEWKWILHAAECRGWKYPSAITVEKKTNRFECEWHDMAWFVALELCSLYRWGIATAHTYTSNGE